MIKPQIVPIAATLALSVLAACSGGGSTGSTFTPATPGSTAVPAATAAPVATAAPAPTTAPAAVPLVTAQLNGSAGFINKNSRTVYVFDADLAAPGTSTCNSQCAVVWPAIVVPANIAVPTPFTLIKRADGSFQLASSGRPFYTYIADSAAGTTAGDGISSFGATWHIARPAGGVTPTPAPGASNPPVSSY